MSGHHNPRPPHKFPKLTSMPCGWCRKVGYPSKRMAKRAISVRFPGVKGLSVYRCQGGGSDYHIGNTAKSPRGKLAEQER